MTERRSDVSTLETRTADGLRVRLFLPAWWPNNKAVTHRNSWTSHDTSNGTSKGSPCHLVVVAFSSSCSCSRRQDDSHSALKWTGMGLGLVFGVSLCLSQLSGFPPAVSTRSPHLTERRLGWRQMFGWRGVSPSWMTWRGTGHCISLTRGQPFWQVHRVFLSASPTDCSSA